MYLEYLRKLYFASLKNVSSEKDADKAEADRNINLAYKEVYRAHRWEYRRKTGQMTLVPRYTTGTVSVTRFNGTNESDARTVTFSGAALAENWRGRYIKIGSSSYWHKIIYLTGSGTSWTGYLDSPVVDIATGGSNTFEIWKRFYYVKSDAEEITDFGRWGDHGRMGFNPDFMDSYSNLAQTAGGDPAMFSVYGVDPYDDIESSGVTVSIAANSNIATFSGGSIDLFNDGWDSGDLVQIGGVDYSLKRAETGTRGIMNNFFPEVVAGSTVLKKNNPVGFQFYNPNDDYAVLPYEYMNRPYDLVHSTKDRIALPDSFIPAIISRAQYFAMRDKEDSRASLALAVYSAELEGRKAKVHIVKPRYSVFAPKIPHSLPGRG